MSSDTFYVTIQAVAGDTVELQCETSTAGGINDFACSRSFVLSVLYDALPHGGALPLQQALSALGAVALWEESFHREHVGKFIESVQLVARSGIVDDENAWIRGRSGADDDEAARAYPLHRFVLRARVTDPRWLIGIEPGARFGTTSFDAWWKDPTTPTREQIAAVSARATHWSPPGPAQTRTRAAIASKPSARKTTKASATTKAATKKTATQKTAARTTAKASATTKPTTTKTARASAATKVATKKITTKKTAAKKTTTTNPAATKPAAKKTAAKKTTTTKPATTNPAAPKITAKKAATKKAAKKTASKKTATTKTAAKKTSRASAAQKTAARKTADSKTANKAAANRAATKKTATRTAT